MFEVTSVLRSLALVCVAFGFMIFFASGMKLDRFRICIPLALDFWLAAGLLKLSADAEWAAIGIAAVIVLVRKVTVKAFSLGS